MLDTARSLEGSLFHTLGAAAAKDLSPLHSFGGRVQRRNCEADLRVLFGLYSSISYCAEISLILVLNVTTGTRTQNLFYVYCHSSYHYTIETYYTRKG